MGLLGKIVSAPIKLANAPIKAIEDVAGVEDDRDRVISKPLESLAKHVEEIDDDTDD